ncbi:hypothetical protein [Gaetbulibacter aestuarii]|uniref:Uncharacterized protein n=1 Tax=Gaetbulibacter aestuarii TaxID=1502358 RepID=A0ABW7N1J8_9FLAO
MENTPVNVQLVGKENGDYLILFPDLDIPVKVNQNLYLKMKQSHDYRFINFLQQDSKTMTA